MRKWIFFFLLISFGVCYSQKAETRLVKSFSKINVTNSMVAILVPSDTAMIKIPAQGGAWNEEIKTKVNGKNLEITTEAKFRDNNNIVYVHYDQEITFITVVQGGIARTDTNEVLKSKKLEISARVDGFTNLYVDVDELIIAAGSGSDIYIRGKAGKVTVVASSGAKVHMDDLECRDADVTSNMGAKVWLTVNENYKATAGSGGKIYYTKEPNGTFERSRITGGNVELIPE